MKHLDTNSLDTALLRPGTPMFSDVIRYLEDHPEPPRTRDMISGLRRVARALGRTPEETPADPRWLQPRLEKVEPAALGLTKKSWSTARSDARAGLARFGVVDTRPRHRSELNTDWRPLWDLAIASGNLSLQAALRRFVYFLSDHSVVPSEVAEAHALAFRDALEASEISKSPDDAYRTAVRAWNQAVRLLPDWPQTTIPLTSRQKYVRMPEDTFPESFRRDLDLLVERLTHPDPFDATRRSTPVRSATAHQYRRRVACFAAELVRSGVAPEAILDIATICDPVMVERGLRQMLSGNGNATSRTIEQTAGVLRNLAGSYCELDDEARAKLTTLARRAAMKPQKGMTRKNQDRLRPLQDPGTFRRLLQLPDRLFAGARSGPKPHARALDREIAVALAILLVCPIRVGNLARIHLEQNLQRPGDGRVFLVFEEEEVKNARRLEFDLPQDLVRMIDRHLATRVPELCPPGTPWLFPRRTGDAPTDPAYLSKRITRIIRRTTGLAVNPHLFRHLAVMVWLDASPGGYEAARRLLGHADLSHTLNLYSGMEIRTATRAFADLIATKKGKRR